MTDDNHVLEKFEFSGIPPVPRGRPQVEVTFEINTNGILNVGAEDEDTWKSEKITIKNDQGRLTEEAIDGGLGGWLVRACCVPDHLQGLRGWHVLECCGPVDVQGLRGWHVRARCGPDDLQGLQSWLVRERCGPDDLQGLRCWRLRA